MSAADPSKVHVIDPCGSNEWPGLAETEPITAAPRPAVGSFLSLGSQSQATIDRTPSLQPVWRAKAPSGGVSVTAALAEFVTGTKLDDCSEVLLDRATKIIVDTVGVTVAGLVHPQVKKVVNFVRDNYNSEVVGTSRRGCTIPTQSFKTTPDHAAFVNGWAGHIHDFDDTWHPPTHAATPMLPAILALAEQSGKSGSDVLGAFLVGMEVQGRLLLAGNDPNIPKLFHPPGYIGMMGSAAACSKLLDLDTRRTQMALGLAASRCSGLMGNVGTCTKSSHAGHSARMGLESALLAAHGLTASLNMIEHAEGFAAAFFGDKARLQAALVSSLDQPHYLEQQDVAIKQWPSHLATQWAITAGINLHNRLGSEGVRRIRSVTLEGPIRDYIYRPHPKDHLDAKFSLEYTSVAALLDGNVGFHTFQDPHILRDDIQDMLNRLKVVRNPAMPNSFNGMWITLTAHMEDGSSVSERADTWKGHWSNPMNWQEVESKFFRCVTPGLTPLQARKSLFMLRNIGQVADIAQLMNSLAADPQAAATVESEVEEEFDEALVAFG